MDFKYKAKFESISRNQKFSLQESKAALQDFEGLDGLYDDEKELIKHNSLILPISFVIGNCNLSNANDDVLLGSVGVKIKDVWSKRPINIEHCRQDVVGYINKSSLCTFRTHRLINHPEDINKPFAMAASGYIWRHIGDVAEMIEESNKEGSYLFKQISVSWELGFGKFGILVGSRNVSQGILITDEEEVEKKQKFLRHFGGDGIDDDGNEVYLVINDEDALPLGTGIVMQPASGISGVSVFSFSDSKASSQNQSITQNEEHEVAVNEDILPKNDSLNTPIQEKFSDNSENQSLSSQKEEKSENKISQNDKPLINIKSMTNFDELYEQLSTAGVKVDPIRDFINKELKKKDEELAQKEQTRKSDNQLIEDSLASLQKKNEENEKARAEAEAKSKELVESVAALQKKLEEVESKQVLETRLEQLGEKYEFSKELQESVANAIKNKSQDEFDAWLQDPLIKSAFAAFERKVKTEEQKTDEVIEQFEKVEVSTASLQNKQEAQESDELPVLKYTFTKKSK